ncbi:MurR/RpiR family transcriptional regulator [Paenibacillus sp. GM2]|uniref:MurR/RpiR family transcriptional regulator n=1 Tax=Paenibacillus sp. GM2 TaxID=1622070 RepID=UPI000839D60D|nr:MurR/RpiR family transcriptional regulator [Paenibacillus sp. GM2]
MGQVLERFGTYIEQLSNAEKYVLYYIDNHFETAKRQSLVEMAEAINVSTTTVIRTCKKLGLTGFADLRYILRTLNDNNALDHLHVVQKYVQHLHQSLDNIDHERISQMAQIMLHSKTIVVVSVGLTKALGEYFAKRLLQVHKQNMHVYESHIIDLLPNMLQNGDIVVFISMSGQTATLVKAAEKIRFTGAQIFTVTNNAGSRLSQLATHNISTSLPTESFSGYDITPRSPLVVLLDILLETYMKKLAERKPSNRYP